MKRVQRLTLLSLYGFTSQFHSLLSTFKPHKMSRNIKQAMGWSKEIWIIFNFFTGTYIICIGDIDAMGYCDPADDNVKCDDDYVKKDVRSPV